MDDADRFVALYEREREVAMVFVMRRTLDGAVAADLTAETFALALRSWSRLRGRSEEARDVLRVAGRGVYAMTGYGAGAISIFKGSP